MVGSSLPLLDDGFSKQHPNVRDSGPQYVSDLSQGHRDPGHLKSMRAHGIGFYSLQVLFQVTLFLLLTNTLPKLLFTGKVGLKIAPVNFLQNPVPLN